LPEIPEELLVAIYVLKLNSRTAEFIKTHCENFKSLSKAFEAA
jgi:hypothetical protein